MALADPGERGKSWNIIPGTVLAGLGGGGQHAGAKLKARRSASRLPSRNAQISFGKSGAGEGIRTLDPNLGKVVLYP